MEKYGKTGVFPGGYGRIGEIPHERIRSEWGHGVIYQRIQNKLNNLSI